MISRYPLNRKQTKEEKNNAGKITIDSIAAFKIEELMRELAREFTIVVVSHNMRQTARVSDETLFLTVNENRSGVLVEYGPTSKIFTNPRDPRTEVCITGRYG